ncbi:MAG: PIG-L deacetylase family protein [Pyrinomonadaceae bacterium]
MNTPSNPGKRPALLAVFAHPDDESLAMGGTLARYAQAGVDVSLVCATRGEWGLISDPTIVTRENLGEVREQELRAACRVLGITHLHFLDCPDSDVNHTDWPEVEAKIVSHIRELQPDVIVTFGPDGLYGHPDHIAVSTLTTAAFKSAGEACQFTEQFAQGLGPHRASKLYYAQFPQNFAAELIAALSVEHDAPQLWGFDADMFGVPEELITTTIDVADEVSKKIEALRCHRTQLEADNVFALIDEHTARRFLSREYFRLAEPDTIGGVIEEDLFHMCDAQSTGVDVGWDKLPIGHEGPDVKLIKF